MTCAPCFAACSMNLTCFATIESLSPVQATWTSAAFTVVISPSPFELWLGRDASGEHNDDGRRRPCGGRRGRVHVRGLGIALLAIGLVIAACGQPAPGTGTSPAPSGSV